MDVRIAPDIYRSKVDINHVVREAHERRRRRAQARRLATGLYEDSDEEDDVVAHVDGDTSGDETDMEVESDCDRPYMRKVCTHAQYYDPDILTGLIYRTL